MLPEYIWLIPILPAIGVAVNGLLGMCFGNRGVAAVAISAVGLALALALNLFWIMLNVPLDERIFSTTLYRWLSVGNLQIQVGLLLDPLSMVMVLVILFVGFLIHVYSSDYMKDEPGYRRFFVFLNLFIFFMLLLVMADNLILTFVGWEGVGLCSYLLIGFWHEKKSACDAGRKAFVVNRIGDFGFILGILLVIVAFETVNFREMEILLRRGDAITQELATIIALLLFVGAMGKSAQFPFHVWLPDAMEGPTPVSALIHAATMVNAGVYLMCRIAPLLEKAPFVLSIIAAVGLVTAVYAALSALGQSDIKRVLAYSTVSQIGYMFVAVGCGLSTVGMFHLVTHGIFKGLLFLGAGALIHTVGGKQELNCMGGLIRAVPVTSIAVIAGLLALAGIFPLSGFFSKDAILWGSFEHFGVTFWMIAFFGALVTALYCGKLFSAILGERKFNGHLHPPGPIVVSPLIILASCALAVGILGLPLFTRDTIFSRFLGPSFGQTLPMPEAANSLEEMMTFFQALAVIGVIVTGVVLFVKKANNLARWISSHQKTAGLFSSGFWIDRLYEVLFIRPVNAIAEVCARIIDNRIIDGLVNGMGSVSMAAGRAVAGLQTGELRYYTVSIMVGVFAFIGMIVFLSGIF